MNFAYQIKRNIEVVLYYILLSYATSTGSVNIYCMIYFNPLLHNVPQRERLAINFNFYLRRDHKKKKIPMSVATMSR